MGVRSLITYRTNQWLSEEVKDITLSKTRILLLISTMVANLPTTVQLLNWIVLNTNHNRDIVTSNFMPALEGLTHLVTKYDDVIDGGFHNYQRS